MTEYIQCAICGKYLFSISPSHLRLHNTTVSAYKLQFPNSPLFSKNWYSLHKQQRTDDTWKAACKGRSNKVIENLSMDDRKKKFGHQGSDHPLFGKRQTPESTIKNSNTNIQFWSSPAGKVLRKTLTVQFLLTHDMLGDNNPMRKNPEYSRRIWETRRKNGNDGKGKKNPNYGKKLGYGNRIFRQSAYLAKSGITYNVLSSYELRMCKILDAWGIPWVYNTLVRLPYTLLDGTDRTYIPDFIINPNTEDVFYIETKGWFPPIDQYKMKSVRAFNDVTIIVVDEILLQAYEEAVCGMK